MSEQPPKTREEIEDLLDKHLPHGTAHVAAMEQAVRAADAIHDDPLSYEARTRLIEAAFFGGSPEKGVVAFAWCVAKSDEDPIAFPESDSFFGVDLLWMFKWIAQHLHSYPQVTRAQVEATLADMEVRYARHGHSLRPVHALRAHAALELDGDVERARELLQQFRWAKRDRYADCAACEDHSTVDFFVKLQEYDKAFEAAEPLLSGARSCAEIPHETYACLLAPARALGKDEEAERLHKIGLPMIIGNPDFVRHLAYHLDHLTLTGARDAARELVPKQIEWAMNSQNLGARMWAFSSLRLFFESEQGAFEGRIPKVLREALGGARVAPDTATLRDYFEGEAEALATRFDARNGNELVSRRLRAHRSNM